MKKTWTELFDILKMLRFKLFKVLNFAKCFYFKHKHIITQLRTSELSYKNYNIKRLTLNNKTEQRWGLTVKQKEFYFTNYNKNNIPTLMYFHQNSIKNTKLTSMSLLIVFLLGFCLLQQHFTDNMMIMNSRIMPIAPVSMNTRTLN